MSETRNTIRKRLAKVAAKMEQAPLPETLHPALIMKLRSLIDRESLLPLARRIHMSPDTLTRVLAGLPVRRASLFLLKHHLESEGA